MQGDKDHKKPLTPVPGDHSECGPDCCITGDRCDGSHAPGFTVVDETSYVSQDVFDAIDTGGPDFATAASLEPCPMCMGRLDSCPRCGGTGFITVNSVAVREG